MDTPTDILRISADVRFHPRLPEAAIPIDATIDQAIFEGATVVRITLYAYKT